MELAWSRRHEFLNIFAKKIGEKMAILTRNNAKICKNLIVTLVIEKNYNVFAENCRKL
jgi:hypothetical protein